MTNVKPWMSVILTALATIATGTGKAEAQKKMVVLIDATSSMSLMRTTADGCETSDGNCTRLDAAKAVSVRRVQDQIADLEPDETLEVAVYTFNGIDGLTPHTSGRFVDPALAITRIRAVPPFGWGTTPLAASLCEVARMLYRTPAEARILQLSSDGEENDSQGECYGVPDDAPPYDPASWQGKVHRRMLDRPPGVTKIAVHVDLFEFGPFPSLELFFDSLARATDGSLVLIPDDGPLP